MAKIVSNFFMSLDSVVESPDQWHFPYFNEEMGVAMGRVMQTSTAFLMGRVLYEEWAAHWPSKGDDDPFALFINNAPKYVVSDSLHTATWSKTTIVSDDVAQRLRDVKAQTEGDIGISGSATLVRWLLANGLLDELHLLVHPIVVGHGQRLFEDTPTHALELVEHETFSTGVLNLTYAPAAGSGQIRLV
ncbi:MAG: dihydrofolate reductase family protein [Actinomycetota bacterium]|nr:dihydrofolate reductase family protein [Actinomycetota bacterium]